MAGSWSASRTSTAGLVLANLVPLGGVLVLGWDLHSLLVVYWLESGVVGGAFAAKIRRAEGETDPATLPSIRLNDRSPASFVGAPNRQVLGFFLEHYGAFWLVHGLFVMLFPFMFSPFDFASPSAVGIAFVGLLAYHFVSYRVNFLGDREYEHAGPAALMIEPYRRVLVLHVTIVVGAFVVASVGAPVGALAVMVLAKTLLDLRGHWREHDRARERVPSPSTPE